MPYTIEARSLDIADVASHEVWVLRDDRGKALAALHGAAADRYISKVAHKVKGLAGKLDLIRSEIEPDPVFSSA